MSEQVPLMTPEQVGEMFQVTGKKVLQWYHDGVIPAEVAVGKVYRFDGAAVAVALKAAEGRGRVMKTREMVPVI